MPTATKIPLASVTLSSATSSITFGSISQSYTDLVLVTSLQVSAPASLRLQFNGDTGSNYSATIIYADGVSTKGSGRYTNSTSVASDALSGVGYTSYSVFSPFIFNIMSYSNTTTYKSALTSLRTTSGGYLNGADLTVAAAIWRSTSAISSITIFASNSANLAANSTFNLYGIL